MVPENESLLKSGGSDFWRKLQNEWFRCAGLPERLEELHGGDDIAERFMGSRGMKGDTEVGAEGGQLIVGRRLRRTQRKVPKGHLKGAKHLASGREVQPELVEPRREERPIERRVMGHQLSDVKRFAVGR